MLKQFPQHDEQICCGHLVAVLRVMLELPERRDRSFASPSRPTSYNATAIAIAVFR